MRAVLLGLALVAMCLVPSARAAYMIPGGNVRPKDFSLIKSNGVYHLFYILNDVSLLPGQSETMLGHAVSYDLYHWSFLPPVLPVDTLGWDNAHVWAPHIVQRDELWWMVYAGVSVIPGQYDHTQRLGLAVSSDLMTWNRVGTAPVFAATDAPWAWSKPSSPQPAFRDPFVMPDPANPGSWLMYYTASYAADTVATVVGVARSTGDFTQWSDVKPLLETWRDFSFNPLTESPHLFQHNGLWYLFITTSAGQPLTFYTGTNPTGEIAEWTYRGRLRNMLGFDTSTWFASEYYLDGTHDLFLFVSGDRIEVREIQWGSGYTFSLLQPQLFHVVSMQCLTDVVHSGDMAQLLIRSANPLAGLPDLQLFAVDSLGGESLVPADSLGFFAHPSFFTDTTYYGWVSHRYPFVSDSDTVTVSRFRVRTRDRTAASGIVTVRAPRQPQPPVIEPPPPDLDPPGDAGGDLHTRFGIRSLSGTPMGSGPALAVQLGRSGTSRVDLYDLAGRRVRNLAWRALPAGVSVLTWDGRDDAGAPAPRGVYFARLQSLGRTATVRVLLAR